MQTAIITDTNSGITVEEGKKLGIYVIPMPVNIGKDTFLEGVDISHAQLYDAMKQLKDIFSSQPSPGKVMEIWDAALNSGYDEIVYIPMSSGLSGSCHNAIQLSQEYGGKVQVVDNHRISVTLRESVLDAKYLAKCGLTAPEIKRELEKHAFDSSIYITVNSLDYLKKSGRVTAAGAAFASVLNLKPVLTIQGDKLDAFAKIRGMKLSEKKMIEAISYDREKRFGDVKKEQLRIAVAGTFEEKEDARAWQDAVQNAFPEFQVYYSPLSCSIACHVGMNAAGIAISRIEER